MTSQDTAVQNAYADGKRMGIAISAVAMSLVAFLSLLGLEKALLALTLGLIVIRGAERGSPEARSAKVAVAVAAVYITCFLTAVVLFHDRIAEFLKMLQKLS